jgi:hypothetical protein
MTVVAGFAAVRFLKSSASSQTRGVYGREADQYPQSVGNTETAKHLHGAGSGMPRQQRI